MSASPDLPSPATRSRDFRYELAEAFIGSGRTEYESRQMADEFLAARDAAVRAAALREAADWLLAQCPPNPEAGPESSEVVHGAYGCACESVDDLRALATTQTPTTPET